MEVEFTGSGSSLYWATVRLSVNGVKGVYVLDTGGNSIVSKHRVSDTDLSSFPSRIKYGSGTVVGFKTKGLVALGTQVQLDTKLLHRVAEFPFREGVDGILGLLPSDLSSKAGIKSVEVDFASRTLKFNLPPTHARRICVNDFQHPVFKKKLWFFGALKAFDVNGNTFEHSDVYFMLDTGATKALTFFDSSFNELENCTDSPKLMRFEVTLPSGKVLRMRLPVNSVWPVCLPHRDARSRINFAILGLQALSSLKSMYFEYNSDATEIARLCVTQH